MKSPKFTWLISASLALTLIACRQQPARQAPAVPGTRARVTFLELGSVGCLPCKEMQHVMASIQARYGNQVAIIFYNVLKGDEAQGDRYSVRVLPTQVFLDSSGKEFSRHEGFDPESDIDTLLQHYGLRPHFSRTAHD